MDNKSNDNKSIKLKTMLITVGTTKFENLIKNIDQEEFYNLLDRQKFSKLIIQKGIGVYIPHKFKSDKLSLKNITVEVHELLPNFENIIKNSDYIISHAGAGNVLESLKNKKKLFVAVNDMLMDNHQVELAEALEKDKYIFYIKNLSNIIHEVKSVLESENSDNLLKQYPDFNMEIMPNVIYDMLEI
jgi:beta-1,4-N-acetylglucosaminyltransferase